MKLPQLTMMITGAALLAAPSLAAAQQADAVLLAEGGELRRYSGQGEQTLLRCVERKVGQIVVPPYGHWTNEQPCSISSLTADPNTGRWALGISASPERLVSHELIIDGASHKVPMNGRGEAISSGLLVYGDEQGVKQIWPGIPKARNKKGGALFQHVDSFSEDGSRLWVHLLSSSRLELWSWTLGPEPTGAPVKAPTLTDNGFLPLLVQGAPLVIREANGSKLRAAWLPADGAPRLDHVTPIKQGQASWRSPIILGDDMFYYVEGGRLNTRDGSFQCDPARPGTYRRMNLKTG